jgi:hypothetical protein
MGRKRKYFTIEAKKEAQKRWGREHAASHRNQRRERERERAWRWRMRQKVFSEDFRQSGLSCISEKDLRFPDYVVIVKGIRRIERLPLEEISWEQRTGEQKAKK